MNLYRPLNPTLNYPNTSYHYNKNMVPCSVVGQWFGDNKACLKPDGTVIGTWDNVCPAGTTSVYKAWGLLGHNGLDIACRRGDPLYAAHDGVISRIEGDKNAGYGIRILSDLTTVVEGKECRTETIYWHVVPLPIVHKGERVRVGDLIGFGDSTGYSSGDHLHWGLKFKTLNGLSNAFQNNGYDGASDPLPYVVEQDAFNKKLERWTGIVRAEQVAVNAIIIKYYRALIALKFGNDPIDFSDEMLRKFQGVDN